MLPILAAINAVDAADKLATGAMALWKQMTASKAEAKSEVSASAGSFIDALASQGVVSGNSNTGSSGGPAGVGVSGQGWSDRILNRLT